MQGKYYSHHLIQVYGGGIGLFFISKALARLVLKLGKGSPKKPALAWFPVASFVVYFSCGFIIFAVCFLEESRLGFASVMMGLCSAAFVSIILTDPGSIPDDPQYVELIPGRVEKHEEETGNEQERFEEGRHCGWCGKYKPNRAHHCSICRRCVLKMDLHYAWFNTCVGFRNQRFMMQLLIYGELTLLCVWTALPVAWDYTWDVQHTAQLRSLVAAVCFNSVFDGICWSSYLAFYLWLLKRGMTQVEFTTLQEVMSTNPLGSKFSYPHHFRKQWGMSPVTWFLPVLPPPAEDGLCLD